jgi:WxL domain surface cell wall-binding
MMKCLFNNRSLACFLGLGLVCAMLIGGSKIAAFADGGGVNATLNSGGLTETNTSNSVLTSVILNGQNQMVNYSLPVSVTDATGLGGGWSLTITSTQFSTSGTTAYVLSASASSIVGVSVSCGTSSQCTNPTNAIGFPQPVPAAMTATQPLKFFQAMPNTGLGIFTIMPMISISIPGNTYAGIYNSTATLAVVSGP